MLGQQDVGGRVVVRRVVGERDGRPLCTDVLGTLLRLDARELAVRPADGSELVVPLPLVVAAKRVPARAAEVPVDELERIAAATWPAVETGRLGGWLLRAAGGWTGRANTALVAGDPGLPLPAAIDRVVEWYAARGLRPGCQLPAGRHRSTADEVAGLLAERGWVAAPRVHVLAASVEAVRAVLARTPPAAGLPPVRLVDRPAADWLAVADARKGGLPPAAVSVLTAGERRTFAEVRADGGELIATGRGAVEAGWLGVTLVEVVPAYRRRGLARLLMAALVDRGADRDRAENVFLQVEETNTAARALYAKLGFRPHHSYLYRRAPGAAQSC